MKKLLIGLLVFGSLSAFAQANESDWLMMSTRKRIEAIDSGKVPYSGMISFEELGGSLTKNQAIDIVKNLEISTERIDQMVGDKFVAIGGIGLDNTFDVYKLDGKIKVIGLGFYRKGGEIPEGLVISEKYFGTEAEARAAGIDTEADVAWSLPSIYFEKTDNGWAPLLKEGTILYFSWTGH